MMQLCDVHSTPLRAHHGIVDSHFGLLRGRSSGRFAEFFGYERYLMVISRVLTGRGADIILIDDPLKPEEALSDARRQATNEWYDHTLYSRQNDKRHGAIVVIMQRLHEDDLVGHVLGQEEWEVVRFPAIAEADEVHDIETIWRPRSFTRRQGDALHPEREPLDTLDRIRRTLGEYNFAGQY